MQVRKLVSLLDEQKAKLVVLLCHHNADPDAVCSAYVLSRLLKKLRPALNVEIAAAQGPSRLSKHLLKFLQVQLTNNPHLEDADVIVLLDTNTIKQLDEWAERVRNSAAKLVVIDHHASHPETESLATLSIADEKASSTCEIVYKFFRELEIKLDKEEAKALFLGIAFDTRHFVLATSETLKILAELIDSGIDAQETLSLLSLPMDEPERIARLKACKRAKLMKIDSWIIAFSHVSAYQASAARAIIGLGADLAVVAGKRGDSLRVSLRCTHKFHKETGIHLGRDIAKPLGERLQGMGGGHSVSAGANGTGDVEDALKYSVRLLRKRLGNKDPSHLQ